MSDVWQNGSANSIGLVVHKRSRKQMLPCPDISENNQFMPITPSNPFLRPVGQRGFGKSQSSHLDLQAHDDRQTVSPAACVFWPNSAVIRFRSLERDEEK